MEPTVKIIHRPERLDRLRSVSSLMQTFPAAEVIEAKVPLWESVPTVRAMRGCTLSHLSAVKAFLTPESPLILFEDDASKIDGVEIELDNIPEDAGIVLYGADVAIYGDANRHGFRQALAPFFGTQCVLYHPRLLKTDFLLNAFEIAATTAFGPTQGCKHLCFESVLLLAIESTGLKIYRPSKMGYVTTDSEGESGGEGLRGSSNRSVALEATDRDSLLDRSLFDPVFDEWAGKRAALLEQPGNVGDALIRAATLQLFNHYDIILSEPEEADVLMYAGGGCMGTYEFRDLANVFESTTDKPRVILPQTWGREDKWDENADRVWCREHTSLEFATNGVLAPDLALGYRPSLVGAHSKPEGIFFRKDPETTMVPRRNTCDPAHHCRSHYDYLRMAGDYILVHTNRMHFAIAALMMGSKVVLYPNGYHKNRSVHEAWLADLGCEFSEDLNPLN